MAKEYVVRVEADAQEVHHLLRESMSHVELVTEDIFRNFEDGTYIAILLYEHYFMRAGNQLALMLVVSGDDESVRVKSVACAGSRDLFLNIDWGSAGDFAYEPISILERAYPGKIRE